ncbi:MAG: hypothetical protein JXA99_05260 [Candidatus Lokiarchaeota archaeon]|nr:hypothetical protein [Candidatus Lokiarchaeota archaeon]
MTDGNKNKEKLDEYIEFIFINLKIEFNQSNTDEINSQIKLIIEEYFNKLLYLFEIEKGKNIFLDEYFIKRIRNKKQELDKNNTIKKNLEQISDLNLIYDFGKLVSTIKESNIDSNELDNILTYLIMLEINRKKEKLNLLFCPFSNSCILPKKESICKFPHNKICPEYQIKEKNLKLKF